VWHNVCLDITHFTRNAWFVKEPSQCRIVYRVVCRVKIECVHVLVEDGRMVRICLIKADKTAASCWQSLLTNQFAVDAFVADQMQQKLTLQRFQLEVSLGCSTLQHG